jgi:hypothetical protein
MSQICWEIAAMLAITKAPIVIEAFAPTTFDSEPFPVCS